MHRPTVKSAKPLTKREREWLNELERVMRACPSTRLACYTTGDKTLYFYDAEVSEPFRDDRTDAGKLHEKAGSALADVTGSFFIESCAG